MREKKSVIVLTFAMFWSPFFVICETRRYDGAKKWSPMFGSPMT